jgi:hypothetical protein
MNNTERIGRLRVCLLAAAVTTTGCASVRVDDAGRTHIAGLVWMTLPPAPEAGASATKAADVVRARTVGLTVQRTPDGSAVVLGYSDATLATVYNNSSVRLPLDQPNPKT